MPVIPNVNLGFQTQSSTPNTNLTSAKSGSRNPKGTTAMEIFHYLQSTNQESSLPAIRFITNYVSSRCELAYRESQLGRGGVVNIAGTDVNVMALDTGNHDFALLRFRAEDIRFKITCVPNEYLAAKGPESIVKKLGKVNFAWASASSSYFIKFPDFDGWGLEPLGLTVSNDRKLSKRLTEALRSTAHAATEPFTYAEFRTPDGDDDIYYDGGNAIRRSFAVRMGFAETRGNIRALLPEGLVKGDCLVVDDDVLDYDLVYHTENLKHSLRTTGWMMATIMKHSPMHSLRHDDQTRGNFKYFIPTEVVRGDLNAMVSHYKQAISTGGELFNYLQNAQGAFNDPIAVDLERIELADTLEEQAQLLREIGIAPATFSNITYTHVGALVRKMEAQKIPGTKIHRRMFIPARNAFLGAVSTWEFCTTMCGMEFPGEDGTRTFFDPRVGLVIPGYRFADTYDLHGGHDGDDTWGAFAIKVYCSDDDRLDSMIESGVIDPTLVIGRDENSATFCSLMVRRPNGPGEYSIERIAEDMPWFDYNSDSIQTVDLANAPLEQDKVFANTIMGEIPTSVNYDGEYDRHAALTAIDAQITNPGVGTFANVLMCWAQTFGADVVPSEMIASMEDVIDSLQQTADPMSFIAIRDAVSSMWVEFRNRVIATGTKVDPILLVTRIPQSVQEDGEKREIGSDITGRGLVERGDNYRLQKRYNMAIDFLRELSMMTANYTRNETDLATEIRAQFQSIPVAHVENWLRMANGRLKKLDRQFSDAVSPHDNALIRRQIQLERRLAMENFMDKLVDNLVEDKHDEHAMILAMYAWITSPRPNFPSGDIDRIFIQPSSPNHASMLQLFIEAVAMKGMLS